MFQGCQASFLQGLKASFLFDQVNDWWWPCYLRDFVEDFWFKVPDGGKTDLCIPESFDNELFIVKKAEDTPS